jgi:nicotinate phosphoribosyltransferase
MQQFFLHNYSSHYASYRFKNRSDINLVKYTDKIKYEIDCLCDLTLDYDELDYLSSLPFITDDYVDFLTNFKLKNKYVTVSEKDGKLDIFISGPIIQVMMFEIYILKIIQELYTNETYPDVDYGAATDVLNNKICILNDDISLFEFGTRRCFNSEWHEKVIQALKLHSFFKGTSNVYYAKKYGITPIGTQAHEYFQFFQGIKTIKDSQKIALQEWLNEYGNKLNVCLTDTLGINKFLKDFDYNLATFYSGVRQDSGNPFQFIKKVVDHYNKLNIDTKTKTIIFSDNLTVEKTIALYNACNDNNIKCGFGIGTNLVNDIPNTKPLQLVIKMVECGKDKNSLNPVAKISDSEGKMMCENIEYITYLKSII